MFHCFIAVVGKLYADLRRRLLLYRRLRRQIWICPWKLSLPGPLRRRLPLRVLHLFWSSNHRRATSHRAPSHRTGRDDCFNGTNYNWSPGQLQDAGHRSIRHCRRNQTQQNRLSRRDLRVFIWILLQRRQKHSRLQKYHPRYTISNYTASITGL